MELGAKMIKTLRWAVNAPTAHGSLKPSFISPGMRAKTIPVGGERPCTYIVHHGGVSIVTSGMMAKTMKHYGGR